MLNIISYFDPTSSQHDALQKSRGLSPPKQALIWALSVIAGLVTLPIAGLGGVATFRLLTRKFTQIDLKKPVEPHQETMRDTAFKTHSQFIQKINDFFTKDGLKLSPVRYLVHSQELIHDVLADEELLEKEPDTFFKIAGYKFDQTPEEFKTEFQNYINTNPEIVHEVWGHIRFPGGIGFTPDILQGLVLHDNIPPKDPNVQSIINMARFELLAKMKNCKVRLHEITIKDATTEKITEFGEGDKVLDIVSGFSFEKSEYYPFNPILVFIQPRELA